MTTLRLIIASLALSLLSACSPTRAETGAGGGPVLVELFTSQGCSSCPPADELLRHLGPDAIPLAFHVDYWDRLGWPDPFASSRWTTRQASYAGPLHTRGMYTPQAVVQGSRDLVGSDALGLGRAVRELHARPPGIVVDVTVKRRRAVTIRLDVRDVPETPVEVFVAITEDGLETDVPRGENAGRTLRNDHVVRALTTVTCELPEAPGEVSCEAEIPEELRATASAVTAWVQERDSRAVLGAGRARLEPEDPPTKR